METITQNYYYPPQHHTLPMIDDLFMIQQDMRSIENTYRNQNIHYRHPIYGQKLLPMIKPMPLLQNPIMNIDDLPGEFNFQLAFARRETLKTKFVYSKKLLKVYINMGQILPMNFTWSTANPDFWLRTTMVFREDHERSLPVQRCYAHMAIEEPDNLGVPPEKLRHVFRTSDPLTLYQDSNGVLSTLTNLGSQIPGCTDISLDFTFYCKNSCTTGMNRRPTQMVFTLENSMGHLLGRRSLQVQICSCPKRDKTKDEREHDNPKPSKRSSSKSKKNVTIEKINNNNDNDNDTTIPIATSLSSSSSSSPPPPPSINNSSSELEEDQTVYTLNLDVLGENNSKAVLKYAYEVMAGQAIRTGNHQLFKPYMDEVLQKMN